jgi:hypothetical protein
MAYMKNGDLADYLQRKPKKPLQLAWIQQMASTIRFTSLPCAQDRIFTLQDEEELPLKTLLI